VASSQPRCTSQPLTRLLAIGVFSLAAAAASTACGTASPSRELFPTTITYSQPARYLAAGPQSTLSVNNAALVDQAIARATSDLQTAGRVYHWMDTQFRWRATGNPGHADVNTLLRTRTFTGCHDAALVYATLLRHLNIAAVMVDTAGISWARDFAAGRTNAYIGHVFVEAYVDGRWIATDPSNGVYTDDYDPTNPVLQFTSVPDPAGYYVLFKGIDPISYGINGLQTRMAAFARHVAELRLVKPNYQFAPLPAVTAER
jgi:hypothetical protein